MEDFMDFINKSNLKVGNEFKYKEFAKMLVNGYTNWLATDIMIALASE